MTPVVAHAAEALIHAAAVPHGREQTPMDPNPVERAATDPLTAARIKAMRVMADLADYRPGAGVPESHLRAVAYDLAYGLLTLCDVLAIAPGDPSEEPPPPPATSPATPSRPPQQQHQPRIVQPKVGV